MFLPQHLTIPVTRSARVLVSGRDGCGAHADAERDGEEVVAHLAGTVANVVEAVAAAELAILV